MAPKPLDFLNRIPTVSELLDKQPVRALTDRWTQSTVAAGVRSFLDELRTDLRRRAAEVPSVRELAELAAKYVVSQQKAIPRTVINATGRVIGTPWAGVPLADRALERVVGVGRDFVLASGSTAGSTSCLSNDIASLVCKLTGAQSAVAVHSYAGALWLALAALASEREVLVSRSEVGEVDAACPLPKLAAAARSILKDVGTANRTTAADYEAVATPRATVLLKVSADEYRIVGETAAAELEELVALVRDRELVLVSATGAAPLVDPPSAIPWPRRSVRATLAAGVDLVVARGDGVVGGPPCGILAGRSDIVERITAHPLFVASQLDTLRSAALVGTLQHYQDTTQSFEALPLWQLLTTPLENLRNRAERLAPQLAQAADIASAAPVETRSPLAAGLLGGNDWPSHAVALTPANGGNLQLLDRRLSCGEQPVVGRIENDRLLLDLRTVFPRQDTMLVQAVCGVAASGAESASPVHHANLGEPPAP